MEIAKFVLMAAGTFLSVLTLSFAVFQYWKRKQDEKFDLLKSTMADSVRTEKTSRKEEIDRLEKRIVYLETSILEGFQQRMGAIEGELKGIRPILQAIQNWFINNTPTGYRH